MSEIITLARNNSTGKPTQTHILHDTTKKVLCGWAGDRCAEIGIVDTDDVYEFSEPDFCKKCLKIMRGTQRGGK